MVVELGVDLGDQRDLVVGRDGIAPVLPGIDLVERGGDHGLELGIERLGGARPQILGSGGFLPHQDLHRVLEAEPGDGVDQDGLGFGRSGLRRAVQAQDELLLHVRKTRYHLELGHYFLGLFRQQDFVSALVVPVLLGQGSHRFLRPKLQGFLEGFPGLLRREPARNRDLGFHFVEHAFEVLGAGGDGTKNQ